MKWKIISLYFYQIFTVSSCPFHQSHTKTCLGDDDHDLIACFSHSNKKLHNEEDSLSASTEKVSKSVWLFGSVETTFPNVPRCILDKWQASWVWTNHLWYDPMEICLRTVEPNVIDTDPYLRTNTELLSFKVWSSCTAFWNKRWLTKNIC